MQWCAAIAAALVLTLVSPTVSSVAPTAESTPETTACPGFLLPDKSSVIASARCVTVVSDTQRTPLQQSHSVVLVGTDRAPVVVTADSFEQHTLVNGASSSSWSSERAAAYSAVVGKLHAAVADATVTSGVASPIVFAAAPAPAGRVLRYGIARRADSSSPIPSLNGVDASAAKVSHLEQSEVQIVANSECEAALSKLVPLQQWVSGALCGKTKYANAGACAAAVTSAGAGQLVIIEESGAEYALGFVAESFHCTTSSPNDKSVNNRSSSANVTSANSTASSSKFASDGPASSLFVIAPVADLFLSTQTTSSPAPTTSSSSDVDGSSSPNSSPLSTAPLERTSSAAPTTQPSATPIASSLFQTPPSTPSASPSPPPQPSLLSPSLSSSGSGAVDLVNLPSVNTISTTAASSMNGSSSSDEDVVFPAAEFPPPALAHTNATKEQLHLSSVEDDNGTAIPDAMFSAAVSYPFAYLSSSMNATTKSIAAIQIQDGVLLTKAEWIVDPEQIKWVLIGDEKRQVSSVVFERDFANPFAKIADASTIALVTYESFPSYTQYLAAYPPPVTTSVDDTLPFKLKFLDPELVLRRGSVASDDSAALVELEACNLTKNVFGLYCLQSAFQASSSLDSTARMGFVFVDDKLVGLGIGTTALTSLTHESFMHIGSPLRRSFIDSVTNAVWIKGNVYSRLETMYRDSVVRFDSSSGCGGVVIAPEYVLTTASCFLENEGSGVIYNAGSWEDGRSVEASVVHPMYESSESMDPAYNLAILKLSDPLFFPRQFTLASTASYAVGTQAARVDLANVAGMAKYQVTDDVECHDVTDEIISASSGGGTVCAGSESTTQSFSDSTAFFDESNGSPVLLGLQVSQGGGEASAVRFVSMLSIADFINAHAVGHPWQSDTGATPIEELAKEIPYPFVYIWDEGDDLQKAVVGVHISANLVLTNSDWIHVPLRDLKSVLFGGEKIAIASFQLERERHEANELLSRRRLASDGSGSGTGGISGAGRSGTGSSTSAGSGSSSSARSGSSSDDSGAGNGYLVIFRLQRGYVHTHTSGDATSSSTAATLFGASPMSTNTPQVTVEVKFLDPILLRRGLPRDDGHSYLIPGSKCLPSGAIAGVDCVNATLQNVSAIAHGTPMRMGFMLTDGAVTGLGVGSPLLAEEVIAPFARLDYESRKAFIDVWARNEALKYRNAAVKLVASGQVVDCGGMLIAPEFVLTTASCVQLHSITGAVYGGIGGDDSVVVDILNDETVAHPLYRSGDASTLRYNSAILKLASPAPEWAFVPLASLVLPIGAAVIRVDLSGDASEVAACSVLPNNRCNSTVSGNLTLPDSVSSSPNTTTKLSSGIICAGNDSSSTDALASTSAALLGKIDGVWVLVGLQVGPDSDPFADSYASVRDAANFINAFSTGHRWYSAIGDVGFGVIGPPGLVGLRASRSGRNFCSGVLIAAQFVLTAAHCANDGLATWASVTSEETIAVDRIHIHPSFGSPNEYSFDAAILELKAPAYEDDPITLEPSTEFADGTSATFYSKGYSPSGLGMLNMRLPLWSRKKCEATVPDVDSSILCAGGQAGMDACAGDSGSPLVLSGDTSLLIGLVSSGYGCGVNGMPGLYTRIASIRDFITAYTAPLPTLRPVPSPPVPSTPSSVSPGAATPSPTGDRDSGLSPTPSGGSGGSGGAPVGFGGVIPTPVSSTTTPSNSGKFTAPISNQQLSTTSDITRDKVTGWLLGAHDGALPVSSGLRDRLTSRFNEITLYSTGDMSGIARVIAAHDAVPLNQRRDRFGSVSDRREGEDPVSASRVC